MATNYQRGRAFEYRTRDALLKMGAAYVMRAAQSKGKVDLLALWPVPAIARERGWGEQLPTEPWLLQCKTGSARMSPLDKLNLVSLAEEVGGSAYLAQPGPKNRGVEFINLMEDNV